MLTIFRSPTSSRSRGSGHQLLPIVWRFLAKLNTVDGKPFPDYVEFIANNKIVCGKFFTGRVNPNGNSVTVIEDTCLRFS